MEILSFELSKSKSFLFVGVSFLMLLLSMVVIFMGVLGLEDMTVQGIFIPLASIAAGSLSALFFGFSLIFWTVRFVSSQPALELTEEGIVNKSSIIAVKSVIPYADITSVSVQTFLNTEYIVIDVKDERSILEKAPFWKRPIMKFNKEKLGLGLVLINLRGRPTDQIENIAVTIKERIA